tara:strand:+ start:558 stop:1352 length:795 start_codon:yes stop_codon:yes gene_type:complete
MKRSFYNGTCYRFFYKNSCSKNIVLIHGLGLNQDVWSWQIPLFKDYNILIYDLLGHGDSKKPGKTVTLETFSNQLNKLLLKLNISNAILVGFSLGSMISRQYSLNHPDKVKALVLLNSPSRTTEKEKEEILNRSLMLKREGPASSVEAAMERWFSPEFQDKNKLIIELVSFWINRNEKDIYSNIYTLLYYGSLSLKEKTDDKPALILTCDQDFANGPSVAKTIAKQLHNSQVCILKNLRHMALVENYSLVNKKIMSFINNLDFS